MKKVNLGCGNKIMDGWINVDFIESDKVDIVHNLNKYPWPFESNSVDEIYADNVIEHLENFDQAVREIHRILKLESIIMIKVPYFSNPGAFSADHRSFFNLDSFDIYSTNTETRDMKRPLFEILEKRVTFLDEYYKSLPIKLFYLFPRLVYKTSPKAYVWLLSYLFPGSEIHFKLKKIKPL